MIYKNLEVKLIKNNLKRKDIEKCTDNRIKNKIIISYLQEQCIVEHDLNMNTAIFLKEIGINIVD